MTKLKNKSKSEMNDAKQNIKPGYKLTAVGVIPEEWEVKRLGEVGETMNGLTGKTKDDFGTGAPYVTYLNVFNENAINSNTNFDYVIINKEERQTELKYGDIIFTTSSETPDEVGMSSVILFEPLESLYLNSFCFGLRLHNFETIKPEFAVYLFRGEVFRKIMHKLAQGSTRFNLSKSEFKKNVLSVPSLPEQTAIANCLGTWDKGIDTLASLIEAKMQQKKWLMQNLLTGKKRLPGFEGEWKEVRLGEVGFIQTGNTPSKLEEKNWGNDFCWSTADDLNNKYINNTVQKLSEQGWSKARIATKGSVLVTCIASIGKNAIANVDTGFNQQINSITTNENYSNEFLYYLITYFKNNLLKYAGDGAIPILNKSNFESIRFLIPSLPEQTAIATILSTADKEIELLQQKLDAMKEQKRGLMQVLLTGKVRLKGEEQN